MAGIKVLEFTGSGQEAAVNIGSSCWLISEAMNLVCFRISLPLNAHRLLRGQVMINEESYYAGSEVTTKRFNSIRNERNTGTGELEDLALFSGTMSSAFSSFF